MPESNLTKRALAQSLKELMRSQPFSKISVGDICAACGMNRKSFYYHFQDKYDLVDWIFTTEYLEPLRLEEFSSAWEILEDLSLYLYRERDFYRPAFQITGQNAFSSFFSEQVATRIQQLIVRVDPDVQGWQFWDVTLSLVSEAALPAFFSWLTQQEDLDPREFLENSRQRLLNLLISLFSSKVSSLTQSPRQQP